MMGVASKEGAADRQYWCRCRGIRVELEDLLAANAQVRAICDVVPDKARMAQQRIEKWASKRTEALNRRRICIREVLPERSGYRDHRNSMAVECSHGDGWWDAEKADTSQSRGLQKHIDDLTGGSLTRGKPRGHCIMLRNCCYGYKRDTYFCALVRAGDPRRPSLWRRGRTYTIAR